MASRSMPGLDSIRSTCLPACFGLRPLAAARPAPIAQTASEAARRAPVVASASEATRLACRSAPRIGSRKSRTRSCDSVPLSDMLGSGSREPAACPGNHRGGVAAVRNARYEEIQHISILFGIAHQPRGFDPCVTSEATNEGKLEAVAGKNQSLARRKSRMQTSTDALPYGRKLKDDLLSHLSISTRSGGPQECISASA